jgi:isopenicillin N synthase-like dioxygenase
MAAVEQSFTLAEDLRGRRVDFTEVPVVDIAGLIDGTDAEAVGAEICAASERVGFFYVRNHGVDPALCQAAFAQTQALFDLPEAEKMEMHVRRSPVHRGYFPLYEENTDPDDSADRKEGFDLSVDLPPDHPGVLAGRPLHGANVWPDPASLPDFRPTIEAYKAAMQGLATRIMSGFALGLGLPQDWFADKIDDPMAILRLLHYPPQAGHIEKRELGCGAHSDYGCLTILAQGEIGGLQLLNAAGEWIDAPPIPGTFVVNIGEQLARWTNDRFKATLHRVINTSGRERYSLPYFFDPNYDAWVEALPGTVPAGEAPRHAPVLAGEWLVKRLTDTFTYRKT